MSFLIEIIAFLLVWLIAYGIGYSEKMNNQNDPKYMRMSKFWKAV